MRGASPSCFRASCLRVPSRLRGPDPQHLDHERAKGREIAKHEGREGSPAMWGACPCHSFIPSRELLSMRGAPPSCLSRFVPSPTFATSWSKPPRVRGPDPQHLDHERAKGREVAKHEGREGSPSMRGACPCHSVTPARELLSMRGACPCHSATPSRELLPMRGACPSCLRASCLRSPSRLRGPDPQHLDHERAKGREVAKHEGRKESPSMRGACPCHSVTPARELLSMRGAPPRVFRASCLREPSRLRGPDPSRVRDPDPLPCSTTRKRPWT
jgi:hypothetical protein